MAPHAVSEHDQQAEDDDRAIQQLLASGNTGDDPLASVFSRELEVGEKSKDAVDYEDISDDDLPEEESDEVRAPRDGSAEGDILGPHDDGLFADLAQDDFGDQSLDDLFGDRSSPPLDETEPVTDVLQPASGNAALKVPQRESGLLLPGKIRPREVSLDAEDVAQEDFAPVGDDEDDELEDLADEDDETREQRELFALARRQHEERLRGGVQGSEIPAAPQTNAEVFETIWPSFEAGKPPRFAKLLPGKKAFYVAKTPLKPPRPLQPTKVALELCADQERSFNLPGPATTTRHALQQDTDQKGVTFVERAGGRQHDSEDGIDVDEIDEDETVGGVTWRDFQLICEDWDIGTPESLSDHEIGWEEKEGIRPHFDSNVIRPSKSKGRGVLLPVLHQHLPSLEDPEETTRRLSKRPLLDLNDPDILVDIIPNGRPTKRARITHEDFRRDVVGSLSKRLEQRYNISNDEAYDLLKANHQHKVRSTIGNLTIEHSQPAIKLQYPFYKVKLNAREARSFHRPTMTFLPNQTVSFGRLHTIKRKNLRGKETKEIFANSGDLTLGDNSNMTLLESSEEYPTMLSNFGMGSRLINYYRRSGEEDQSRPKLDIGETHVLLPQDKSPFSMFGNIESGQILPTLHNAMYRAPIFKHNAKSTDFLVGRSVTGIHGQKWYIRPVDNIFVVGQQLPSVEVPGTHSRKVTEAAKRRLRMISYRVYKKSIHRGGIKLNHDEILRHLPGSEVSQNRGKMREFMQFNRDTQTYEPRPNEPVPDEATMRSWIKPEDLCQLEATQVGQRHLQDSGYNKDEQDVGDDEEDKGESLEQQLAPWNTTKNFLNACQGKAMLQLHGEGDPSGRGEAFSFVKTSMKGGFKAIGESVEDKIDQKRQKDINGHSYNVARQQKAYDDAIKKIWAAQSTSLSSLMEHSDTEIDVDDDVAESSFNNGARTPRSEYGTPSAIARRDDDSVSQFSRFSTSSQSGKVLKIVRRVPDKRGNMEEVEEVVQDPKVIREYLKRRKAQELSGVVLTELKPTGDIDVDAQKQKWLEDELARLNRNKERRHVREKAKGIFDQDAESPVGASPTAGSTKTTGTQRRCANCGQVGHIKTNKKYGICHVCRQKLTL